MAKRFTDTEKWRDEWWGSLPNDYRMIWLYLLDSCSIAGIWKKDFRGLNFNCNTKITEEDFCKVFKGRIIDRGNFFFLIKFLRFQYPKGLNSEKPAIVSVRKELDLNNLSAIVNQSLGNDYLIIKDKDKDKDEETDKDKSEVEETLNSALDEIYIEQQKPKWKHIDFDFQVQSFKEKVRGSPEHYKDHETSGIRLALQHQLRNAKRNDWKSNKAKTGTNQSFSGDYSEPL